MDTAHTKICHTVLNVTHGDSLAGPILGGKSALLFMHLFAPAFVFVKSVQCNKSIAYRLFLVTYALLGNKYTILNKLFYSNRIFDID